MKQVLCILAIILIIASLFCWVRVEERKAAIKARGVIIGKGWAIIDDEFMEY